MIILTDMTRAEVEKNFVGFFFDKYEFIIIILYYIIFYNFIFIIVKQNL